MLIRLHRRNTSASRLIRCGWSCSNSRQLLRHWPLALMTTWVVFSAGTTTAVAQITVPRMATSGGNKVATLEEQLINRLRATTDERQTYLRIIAAKTEQGVFDQRRILAIERYAMKRNPKFPFPYFERAMRNEADRLGVYLPPVRLLAGPAYQLIR